MVESLRPTRTWSPANYDAAPRKYVDHISTVDDVADFITEYITSDVSMGNVTSGIQSANDNFSVLVSWLPPG